MSGPMSPQSRKTTTTTWRDSTTTTEIIIIIYYIILLWLCARVSVISRVRRLFRTNQYMNITCCCAVRIEIIRKRTHTRRNWCIIVHGRIWCTTGGRWILRLQIYVCRIIQYYVPELRPEKYLFYLFLDLLGESPLMRLFRCNSDILQYF
jgi:hypothetical protein